jgi:hypothetical protein
MSGAEIIPVPIIVSICSRNGPQKRDPITTTGKSWIFAVWMSVRASNISSSVPKPPGITTNA